MAAPALSVQGGQRDAIRKMLQLNRGGEADWDQATAQDDGTWKVLIYDKYCRDIISPLFKVGELKQMNVTLHMMLHPAQSERQRIPDVPAIYFVQPTEHNVTRICEDAKNGLYDSMHLNFSSELPRALMEQLAEAVVAGGVDSSIDRVHDQFSNFVSLEPTLFSLGERDVFPIIHNPLVKDTDIMACVDRIVDGLFCVCATLGSLPVIRCGREGAAEMVAQKLDAKLRDHLQSRNNLFSDALSGRGVAGGLSRPALVLVDRGAVDLPVMLQHSSIYQPQIHDLLAMRANVVSVGAEAGKPSQSKTIHDIDVNEPFFGENARLDFGIVAENIEKGLDRYKRKADEINQKTGGESADGADAAAASAMTAELQSAIAELPKLKEQKRVLDMHTQLAHLLLAQVKERALNEYWQLEEEIRGAKEGIGSQVLGLLQKPSGSAEDKLRLLCTYFWDGGEIESGELDECVAAVKRAGGEEHALSFLRRMKQHVKALSSRDAALAARQAAAPTDTSLMGVLGEAGSMAQKAMQETAAMAKDSMGLESELICPAARMLRDVLANQLPPESDPYLYLDPHPRTGARGGAVVRQHKPFTDAIVFAIGGGNYVEYEQILKVNAGHCIYGATDIVSPREFLSQLEELGRQRN